MKKVLEVGVDPTVVSLAAIFTTGVILISHRLNDVFEVSDRLVVLRNGKVRFDCGFDVVIEASGHPDGLTLSAQIVKAHGFLSILGYHQGGFRGVDMQLWNRKAIEVLNAHERRTDYSMDSMKRGSDLIAAGRFDPRRLVTHRFNLDEVDLAFTALEKKPAGFVKAVVRI